MYIYSYKKRTLDLLLAWIFIMLSLPVVLFFILTILIIYRTNPIYKQERIGRNKESFILYKIKSMIDTNKSQLKITTADDNRITNIGKFIRKYKIDELCQFYNVIKGDMSIVGPRPEFIGYKYMYDDMSDIFSVRPGVTDLASIIFINEEDLLKKRKADTLNYYQNYIIKRKVRLNNIYINNATIWFDLWIIFKTPIKIIKNAFKA